jgi:hypothetical protein
MNSRATALSLLAGLMVAHGAFAGIPVGYAPTLVGTKNTDTKGYAGLRWDLPGTLAPELVVGVRRARIKSNGDVSGGDASFAISLFDGIKPGKLRLKGFTGDTNHQWELGGGYDFAHSGYFFGPSINFPHFTLGADYQPGAGLNGFAMPHTLGEPNQPSATPTCPSGGTYNSTSGLCEGGGPV